MSEKTRRGSYTKADEDSDFEVTPTTRLPFEASDAYTNLWNNLSGLGGQLHMIWADIEIQLGKDSELAAMARQARNIHAGAMEQLEEMEEMMEGSNE